MAPGRRIAALMFAVLLLMAVPLVWMSADALATTGAKATLASHDDDDSSGSGDGDDDTGTDDTATNSASATDTGDTGVSTKAATATNSNSATRTGKTGVSTQG